MIYFYLILIESKKQKQLEKLIKVLITSLQGRRSNFSTFVDKTAIDNKDDYLTFINIFKTYIGNTKDSSTCLKASGVNTCTLQTPPPITPPKLLK
jgi:hypothetical protein